MADTKDIKYHSITELWGNESFCRDFSSRIDTWLQQFDEDDKPLMLKLLQHFYYYTEERLNYKARQLYGKFIEEYPTDSSKAIFVGIEKDVGVGFSSFMFETFWIKNNLKDSAVPRFTEEVKTWGALPDVVAIVDDYSGSGSTFIKYLNKIIKVNPELNNTRYYFLTIHISKDALSNIAEYAKQQEIEVRCVYLHESDRAFNAGYIYEAIEAEVNKTKYGDLCKRIALSEENAFGFKQIEALVSFEYNTPNNTLGVFWSNVDDFMSLFNRHKKQRTTLTELRQKAKQNKNFIGKKIIVQNIEETKLNMFMVYCAVWGNKFSVSRACFDFGFTKKQLNDIVKELIEEGYLEYEEGKLVASKKMKKYVFVSRMSDFKNIFYDLKQKNILPADVEQADTYIPKKFSSRR